MNVTDVSGAMARGNRHQQEVGIDEIQIEWRRWIQQDKSTSGIPDVHRTLYCTSRKQQLSLRVRISKATANTVIATAKGNIRQGRLMAGHGGLYSTTKLRQIGAKDG